MSLLPGAFLGDRDKCWNPKQCLLMDITAFLAKSVSASQPGQESRCFDGGGR
jgi:hypothetical protein